MLTVVSFLWFDAGRKNNAVYVYGPEHVHTLKRMVARHLSVPHRFVCVSDRPIEGVETVPIDWATHVEGTCLVKLMLYRPDIGDVLGERILYLDLDCVVVGALDPLVDRQEDLVLWHNPNHSPTAPAPRRARYQGSMQLIRAGCRPQFWTAFDPRRSPEIVAKVYRGAEQAWISCMASPDEAFWDGSHGVYGAGRPGDIVPGVRASLPDNARIVFFPGRREPGMASVQRECPWVAERYH